MKDPVHHKDKTQRKVLRKARQETEAEEGEVRRPEESVEEEQMPVEVEEQPLWIRPSQRNIH
jgi:hypothetical protein